MFERVSTAIKIGGVFILEGYNVWQIGNETGGPKVEDLMFDLDEVCSYFEGFEVILARNTTGDIKEGLYHTGTGSVVQFIGKRVS